MSINNFENKLIKGDCLQSMSLLEDDSIDAIITDPPYGYLNHKLDKAFDYSLFFKQCYRVLKNPKKLLFFGYGVGFYEMCVVCKEVGFKFKEEIVWNKKQHSSPFGKVSRLHENVAIFGDLNDLKVDSEKYSSDVSTDQNFRRILSSIKKIKNYSDFSNWSNEMKATRSVKQSATKPALPNKDVGFLLFRRWRDGMRVPSILPIAKELGYKHPTQKPLELLNILVDLVSKEEDIILDPFAGSGSTLISAYQKRRRYLGFEIDEEYYLLACGLIEKIKSGWGNTSLI